MRAQIVFSVTSQRDRCEYWTFTIRQCRPRDTNMFARTVVTATVVQRNYNPSDRVKNYMFPYKTEPNTKKKYLKRIFWTQ